MLIYSEKLRFQAPIEHVYDCLTSYEFNQRFFTQSAGNRVCRDIHLHYDKSRGELTVSSDKPLFRITPETSEKPQYASGMFIQLADVLQRFGSARIESWFSEENGITEVYCEINSLKEPGLFWRIFTRIIVFILKRQGREDSVNYIKYVESSA